MKLVCRGGYVYFLASEHGVKIGKSIKPFERKNGIQLPFESHLSVCLAVTDQDAAEKFFHNFHQDRRIRNEWFRGPVSDLLISPDWSSVDWRWDASRLSFFERHLIDQRPDGFSFDGIYRAEMTETRAMKALIRETEEDRGQNFSLWRDDQQALNESADYYVYYDGSGHRKKVVNIISGAYINGQLHWILVWAARAIDASKAFRRFSDAEQALLADVAYQFRFYKKNGHIIHWHTMASQKLIHLVRDGFAKRV